jgi:hypothetical protein
LLYGFLEKAGGWGLYSSWRIVHLHQLPGGKGDIFPGKFDYDNDYGIDGLSRAGKIGEE